MSDAAIPKPAAFAASPATPLPEPSKQPAAPEVVPSGPKKPWRGAVWMLLLGVLIGGGVWMAVEQQMVNGPASPLAGARTAKVDFGPLAETLRVGGTVEAKNFASITAPRMRGPRDAGRTALTLMTLAEPGSVVPAGTVVAQFELKWLEDHIDDTASGLTQSQAEVEKRRADIMILRETDRQAAVNAKAEYEKAALDLRTAEVRSEIEAEVLANVAEEAKATWGQLEYAFEEREKAHDADLETYKITVAEDRLHLERHQRDFEKMTVVTPLGGLVVMETMYRGGGQFGQVEEGEQVNPGRLFMRVVDLSEMIVSAEINQVDIQSVRIGQPAQVRLDAYPDIVLEGRVASIGAIADSGGGRFSRGSSGLFLKKIPVEIAIDSSDERVIPDLSASADIVLTDQPEEGPIVPRAAVREGDSGPFVYVRQGQKFVTRSVELGDVNDTHALIRSGVEKGEEVLLSEPPPQA